MSIHITTQRLKIREYQEADFNGVHIYAKDPETVQFMTWGPNTPKQTEDFIQLAIAQQKIYPRINFYLIVTLKEINQVIGGCGIQIRSIEHKCAEIGYCFNKEFWRQGYATETVRSLLKLGFEELRTHRMIARCDPENVGSERVLQKSGLRKEAYFKQAFWRKDRWRDSLLYAILESEWFTANNSLY